MTQLEDEKPVTVGFLKQYFNETLLNFYKTLIEPRFLKPETEASEFRHEMGEFRNQTFERFDDLYKKYEDLHQEYILSNHQIKGLDLRLQRLEARLSL